MNRKIRKVLFELSKNIRITTKNLGRNVNTTQQSSSYLINQLEKKKTIQETTAIVDAVKLGFTNVLVGFNYLNFDSQVKKNIIGELREISSIIAIEEAKQGVDLLIEYACSNLSAFNKIHSEIVRKFNKDLETKFVFPVIVKHKFFKNYLVKKFDDEDIVLCGDRHIIPLSDMELLVLHAFVDKPDSKLIDIVKTTGVSVKTVVKIKKKLQKKEILRGFSCVLNNKRLGIRRHIIFLKLSSRGITDINKIVAYARYNRSIIELVKIIGEFHVMLIVEEIEEKDIIKEIRSMFPIDDYLVIESENINKKTYLPLEEIKIEKKE
jgi:DNA-binding Lrp family transcriptional regulator